MKQITEITPPAGNAAEDEHSFRGVKHGWRPIKRENRGERTEVQTRLEIVLDPERSAWVLHEAERTGVDFESYVTSLIDAARAVPVLPRVNSA